MALWLQALLWGLLGGSALLIGSAIGYSLRVPGKLVAGIMAFGAGVLISALSFELMEEAYGRGGFAATAIGFLVGAVLYLSANLVLAKFGARHRKRSGSQQPSEAEAQGSGTAIAIGALLDGIPESVVIGVSMIGGGVASIATVVAVFLSNVPEGLSSSAGMKKAGRPPLYVYGVWGGIALISGFASLLGYSLFSQFSPSVIAATTAVAAGAILAMITDTMIPEAFESAHNLTGFITVLGFLAAFALSALGS
jgi:ZIP family zinc transporter